MEEKKNKVKEFWEENKETVKQEASRALWLVVGTGVGYYIGSRITMLKVSNGIEKCILVKPEFETAFYEARDLLEEKLKK